MNIIFAGNNERGEICLRTLVEYGHNVVAVVTDPKYKEEQGYFRSVRHEAEKLKLPIYELNTPNSSDFRYIIQEHVQADLMIMAGYGKIVKKDTYNLFPHGCWNIHASLLPYDKGPAPLNWALIRGEHKWGVSLIDIDEGIDTGDILAQIPFHISDEDDIASVVRRANNISCKLLLNTLENINRGSLVRTPQDSDSGSYNTKRRPEDGKIDWHTMGVTEIHNLVRALTRPYPGAFSWLNGEKIYIWTTKMVDTLYKGVPGRVARRTKEGAIIVAKDQGILITDASKAPWEKQQNKLFDKNTLGTTLKVGSDLK